MNRQRRKVLRAAGGTGILGLLVTMGVVIPERALAEWSKSAFDAKDAAGALAALGIKRQPENSSEVTLMAPDIAENGAVVPMAVASSLAKVDVIAILIEKNPNPLAALFKLPEGTEAFVQTRCKMAQTSNVYALVKSGSSYYAAVKEIKVTLGGCGG